MTSIAGVDLPPWLPEAGAYALLAGVAAFVLITILLKIANYRSDPAPATDPSEVELDRPMVRTARFGLIQELYRIYRYHQKRKKLADKGYVQWLLVDDTYPTPRYVKPEGKGGGIREYKHDGERYLFPEEAMLPSKQQGMWTVIHRRGDADPINIRDPDKVSIPTDMLEEYLDMSVSTSPPSLWDKLGIDGDDAVKYGIAAIILIAGVQGAMNGGIA